MNDSSVGNALRGVPGTGENAVPPAAERHRGRSLQNPAESGNNASANPNSAEEKIDWEKVLQPSGPETRLGQALRQVILDERRSPIAGIIVFTDGGQNAGIAPEAAVKMAQEAKIPIYPVGVGSDRLPINVRVARIEALPRAYPGDPYMVHGLIQTQGQADVLAGRPLTVQLLLRAADHGRSQPGTGTVVDSRQVILGTSGRSVPVEFEITPKSIGRQVVCLRIIPPPEDHNPGDDFREAEVEVVDRKDHVLLFAGGPTREYGFLRPLLFRDKSITVDVLLETAQPGISQEANRILDHFPATREEMYDYDCIVAFDPNWRSLTTAQVDLLESWVAEQAGGLIVIAGPVYMGEAVNGWLQDPAMAKIRALYPVEFIRRATTLDIDNVATKEPWPLDFTREGLEAEFLWLADGEAANQQAWASFPGVYSYFPVRGPKPSAWVFARFSDPRAGVSGQQPVYLAEQFYGSGRVFYQGSGEMWRLRQIEPAYFDRHYTRLIRHVAQGRALRESSRGTLMVGQDQYMLGDTVEIRGTVHQRPACPVGRPQRDPGGLPRAGQPCPDRHPPPGSQPDRHVRRASDGAQGGRLPPGAAGARVGQPAAHPADPGLLAELGTAEHPAERQAALADRPSHARGLQVLQLDRLGDRSWRPRSRWWPSSRIAPRSLPRPRPPTRVGSWIGCVG